MDQPHVRNFCIIAHIDHGKSTLADRLIEATGTVERRKMRSQVLDAMEIERERGITIKLTPVRMERNGVELNLIDTPGHVDFSYEVSRSLAAVEGAILLVDALQGIQAQTLANLDLARRQGLVLLPVVNKIDLAAADVDSVAHDLAKVTGVSSDEVLRISAKTGEGIVKLLDALVARIPPPRGNSSHPFRGLIFDSNFDPHKGVVLFVRTIDGELKVSDPIAFAASPAEATALELGTFRPGPTPADVLQTGSIGYVATGLRDVLQARVGDTVLRLADQSRVSPLPGYDVPQPNVYAGLYPLAGEEFPALRDALGKLRLSDASVSCELEQSPALGQGYRCGFLGLLHLEIFRERLQREFGVPVTVTVPSVAFTVVKGSSDRTERIVKSAADFPDPAGLFEVREPWARVTVLCRAPDIGAVLKLFAARGSDAPVTESLGVARVAMTAQVPLRTVVVDFHDQLKSVTAGYGSFSLGVSEQRPVDLVKLSILVNHDPVEALSVLVPAPQASLEGRRIVERLKKAIPAHLFAVPLQAAVGGKILARETIPALRKDVTGALYGGDVTRKRKLLEKQKKGKKKLADQGRVTIPPAAFLAVLKR